MKRLIAVLLCVATTPAVSAEDADYTSLIRQAGHTQCTGALDFMANFLVEQEGHFINLWNNEKPATHMVTLLGGKVYQDGFAIVTLNATPTADGGCDLSFTQIIPAMEQSCASLRETTFKDWKYYETVARIPVYEDSTSENVNVMLNPINAGCLIVKSGVVFFDKEFLASPLLARPKTDTK